MKLTYWKAECLHDAACYDIRTKTKKECLAQIKAQSWDTEREQYGKPEKVILEFADSFHLMDCLLSEGSYQCIQIN